MDNKIKKTFDSIVMPQLQKEKVLEAAFEAAVLKRKKPALKIAVTACLIVVAIPMVAFAGEKIAAYIANVKQELMHTDVQLELLDENAVSSHVSVEIDSASGYEIEFVHDNIRFYRESDPGRSDTCYGEIIKVDSGMEEFYIPDTVTAEELVVNGRKAFYLEQNLLVGSRYLETDYYAFSYDKTIGIFFDELGYVLLLDGSAQFTKEELITFAEQVSLVGKETDTDVPFLTVSEYNQKIQRRYESAVRLESLDDIILPKEHLVPIGQQLEAYGLQFEIQAVEVKDGLEDIDVSKTTGLFQTAYECRTCLDENLCFTPYDRETIGYGDGYETPYESVLMTETVIPKLVLVTLEVTNQSWENYEEVPAAQWTMSFVTEDEGQLVLDTRVFERGDVGFYSIDSTPCYVSESLSGKGFYYQELPIGETKVIEIGYVVDEDLLDNMVLHFELNGVNAAEWKCVDLRR